MFGISITVKKQHAQKKSRMYTLHVSIVYKRIDRNSPGLCPKVNFHSSPLGLCSSEMYATFEYRQEIQEENRRGGGGEEDDGRGGGKRRGKRKEGKGGRGRRGGRGRGRGRSRTNKNRRLPAGFFSLLILVPFSTLPTTIFQNHQRATPDIMACIVSCVQWKRGSSVPGAITSPPGGFQVFISESRDIWGTFTQALPQWALQSCDKVLYLHAYVNDGFPIPGSEENHFSVKTKQFSLTSNTRSRN